MNKLLSKIKVDVHISIEDGGNERDEHKVMSLNSFANLVDRDGPAFIAPAPCGDLFPEWILGHLILNQKISYKMLHHTPENEWHYYKSVEAKLANADKVTKALQEKASTSKVSKSKKR